MTRRIILVDFYWTRDKDPRVPLGHASLLTALQKVPGLEVCSLAIPVNLGFQTAEKVAGQILERVENRAHGDVDIAFGAYVWGEELLCGVLRWLREWGFGGRIILGGPQVSYSGEGLEGIYPEADVFVRGYGEDALRIIVQSSKSRAIAGVHWAGSVDLKSQAQVDLEALPSPWLTGAIPLENQQFIRWETQRGCSFRCAFCQHREPGARLKRRALGLPRIEAEIDLFCESDVREIAVLDPIFNQAPHAVGVLERFVDRGFKGRLSLQCRAELITEEFLDAAGAMDVCLEFGLQTIHLAEGAAIQRRNQMEKVDWALAEVRRRDIEHEVSLIFGLPVQTLASFEESVQWCLDREVPVIKAFPLLLLRGTELDRSREKWGLVDSGGAMSLVLQSTSFHYDEWLQMARISEALRVTEGRHPERIEELREIAKGLEPDLLRWIPESLKKAA